MTVEQIADLAKRFQIDTVTICREYLQLVFLNALYQNRQADAVCFKGGTAIRLLLESPRFSEDLDFDTTYSKKEIKLLISDLEKIINRELPEAKIIQLYSGKAGMRFRIKLYVSFLKFPLIVRLDFTHVDKIKAEVSSLQTEFPVMVYSLVYHQPFENVLREKFLAAVEREKGRDLYDIWFLLQRKIALDKKLVTKNLLKRIVTFPQNKLERDLDPFLPKSQRKIIPILKEEITKLIDFINQNS